MEYKKIEELTTVVTGGTPSTGKKEYWENGDIPWLQSGCCQNCDVDSTEKYITQEGYDNSSARIMPPNTVMIALTGATAGKVGYLNFEACGNQSITGILPCDSLNQRYLFYYLLAQRDKILNDCVGGAQAHISQGYVKNIKIPVLSLAEQEHVVQILTKLFDIIIARQKEICALDDLIKARFVEMFGDPIANSKGWDIVELGELTYIGSSKRIFEKEYVSEGIPFYRTKEIVELSKGNSVSTELFITEERFAEIKEKYGAPKAGDLLISAVGTIGVIWIVDGKNDFYFKDGNLIRVDGSEKFNSVYMKNLLEYLIDRYKKQMSTGTAYAALTISGLTKMKVYDIPMELQNKFADFVHQVDKSKFEELKVFNLKQKIR